MKKDRPKTLVYRKGERRVERDYGDRERPQMFHAICANCGRNCEVPFNPTGDKPVYCRDCFNKQEGGDYSPRGGRGGFGGGRDRGGSNSTLEAMEKRLRRIEEKLDALLESM